MKIILRNQSDIMTVQNELLNILPQLKDKPYICEIAPYKKRRSLDANAYFHVLVNKIAEVLKVSDDEIKIKMNLEYGAIATQKYGSPLIIKVPKDAVITDYYRYAKWYKDKKEPSGIITSYYLYYKPTHALDEREMSRLIDGTIQEAKNLGIETLAPLELEKLKGYEKEINYERNK